MSRRRPERPGPAKHETGRLDHTDHEDVLDEVVEQHREDDTDEFGPVTRPTPSPDRDQVRPRPRLSRITDAMKRVGHRHDR